MHHERFRQSQNMIVMAAVALNVGVGYELDPSLLLAYIRPIWIIGERMNEEMVKYAIVRKLK